MVLIAWINDQLNANYIFQLKIEAMVYMENDNAGFDNQIFRQGG